MKNTLMALIALGRLASLQGASADESKNTASLAATFENPRVMLAIDTRGRIASLRSKASNRELVGRPQELVSARLKDGREITAGKVARSGDALTFEFPSAQGAAVLAVETHPDFFTFTVRSLSVPGVDTLTFLDVPVAPAKYRASMTHMFSDDADAVCLRGYELPVEMTLSEAPARLKVSTTAQHGLTGWRAGLAAGPKSEMPAMLRAMAAAAGAPVSKLGGPWALGAEANRGSYLFADLSYAAVDDWIELARRGGFSTLHIHGWWETLGHYDVNRRLFPNGLADLKDAVARIHAAGLKAGLHILSGCIDPRDAWVTPEASPHLIASATYTLARPMTPTDTVICVNEKPAASHDVVFTYDGNGNAIRIGTEIVQYSEVVTNPPYAFVRCQRGAFNTRPAAHAAGERAAYLQQRYLAFYPEPGSPLADALADRIATVFNTCQANQIYFDGSEGMMSRYGIDHMRHAIFKRLRGDVLVESSWHGAHNWWFHSRIGAWDHATWAVKRFHDVHIDYVAKVRDKYLLEPQMGWWAPRQPVAHARGHFLDEIEYFGAKNLGLDSAMAIQGVNVSDQPLPFHTEKQLTLLGWYEQLRLARYFDTQTIARVAAPGDEVRLRQNRQGVWEFTPVKMSAHRISAVGNGSERWTNLNPFAEQPLTARLEALYAAAPYDHPKRIRVAGASEWAAFRPTASSSAVSLRLGEVAGERGGEDRHLRLQAENKSGTRRGSWAKASLVFPAPYRNLAGAGALGVWVKGDGKGALLNLQLGAPREYVRTISDHHVTLDFAGWRYFELLLRERDVDAMYRHVWPYGASAANYSMHANPVDMAHVSELNLYLNNLPPGESTEAIVGPVLALPVQLAELKNPVLTLNGQRLALPITLQSGDFVEFEPTGDCAHYGARGDLKARVHPAEARWPLLKPGENAVAFDCVKPAEVSARAEVVLSAFDQPFGAANPRPRIDWQRLAREYEMPRWITAPEGAGNAWDLPVRPGEKARLEIELAGGMDTPVLTVNGHELRFPIALKPGQRLLCRGERRWRVLDAKRAPIAAGDITAAPPILQGGPNRVSFTCGAPDWATVRLVKVYEP